MKERRLGQFKYSKTVFEDHPRELLVIFSKVVPIDVDFDYVTDTFNVTAWSEYFDYVYEGELIPQYKVVLTKRDGKKLKVDFVRSA